MIFCQIFVIVVLCSLQEVRMVLPIALLGVGLAKQFGSYFWVGYVPEPAAAAVRIDFLSLN
jgi:hypothetical protein